MLNVMFLVYSGVNEDHAHALRDTTPWVIGWKQRKKKSDLRFPLNFVALCRVSIEDWANNK